MSQGALRDRGGFFVAHTVMIHGILFVGNLLFILVGIARFEKLYEGFGGCYPVPADLLFRFSEVARSHIFLFLFAAFALMAGDAVLCWRFSLASRAIWGFLWAIAISCVLVFGGLLMIFALLAPVFSPCIMLGR